MKLFYSIKITINNRTNTGYDEAVGLFPVSGNTYQLRWSESALNGYVPLLISVSGINHSFDPMSPVVQVSEISVIISNHSKLLTYLERLEVYIGGCEIELTLNKFNDDESGELISSEVMYVGKINSISSQETEFTLNADYSKFNRRAPVIKEGEIYSAGRTDVEGSMGLFKAIRSSDKKQDLEIVGASSFKLVGIRTEHNSTTKEKTYYYQIQFSEDPSADTNFLNLVGSWMYIDKSSTTAQGEYRKIISISLIESGWFGVNSVYKGQLLQTAYYYEIVVSGYYTESMYVTSNDVTETDFATFVKFYRFTYDYLLSKENLWGSTFDVYANQEDNFAVINRFRAGSSGYYFDVNYESSVNKITIDPEFVIDEDKIKSFSFYKITSCARITTPDNLTYWQYEKRDTSTVDGSLFLYDKLGDGLYENGSQWNNTGPHNTEGLISMMSDNSYVYNTYYGLNSQFDVESKVVWGIEFNMPAITDSKVFKGVYLGLNMEIWHDSGAEVFFVSKEKEGNAKLLKKVTFHIADYTDYKVINTIPAKYFTTYTPPADYNYYSDWQEKWIEPNTTPANQTTRINHYTTFKIDAETIEDFNKIENIGIFVAYDAGGILKIFNPKIRIYEAAIMLEHETDINEVYL